MKNVSRHITGKFHDFMATFNDNSGVMPEENFFEGVDFL